MMLLLGAVLVSCKKPSNDKDPELQSAVNVVNALVGLKPVGFFINGSKVVGDPLEYTGESGYFITFPGTRKFDAIETTGSDYFLKTEFEFKQNTYHTVFMTGEAGSVTTLFTQDDLSAPPAGKAKVRFVNLSPDSGNLSLSLKNGTLLFPDQDFKTASEFKVIDPGVYDLQLKTIGGTVLTERNVTVNAGSIYTVWVKGLQSGTANSPIGLQFRSIN